MSQEKDQQIRYKTAFEHSLTATLITRPDGTIITANPAACDMFGYTVEQLRQIGRSGIIHTDSPGLSGFLQEREKAGSARGELTAIRKNGETFPCEFYSAIFHDESGEAFTSTTLLDISGRKATDIELKKSLKHLSEYKYALDQAANIVITDVEGYITEVNEHTCKLSGYAEEELIGSHTNINNSGYHPDSFFKELWNTILKGEVWRGEIRNKTKNGSFYWVDTTIVPFMDSGGNPEHFLAIRFDITDQKESQRLVRINEQRFRALVQGGYDYFGIIDEQGLFIYVSPSYEQLLDIPSEELIGRPVADFIHKNDRRQLLSEISELDKENRLKTSPYRFCYNEPDCSDFLWFESTITDLREDPAVRGFIVNSQDITHSVFFQELDKLERKTLKSFAEDKPLASIFDELLTGMEELYPGIRYAFIQVQGKQMKVLSAPSFGDDLIRHVASFVIGKDQGTTGVAIISGEKVFVDDTMNDPRWEPYREFAQNENIRASWSHPIIDSNTSDILAALAVYYDQPKTPSDQEERTVERICELLRLILESEIKDKALKGSNERFRYVNKATDDAIYDWDLLQNHLQWGDGFRRQFGYQVHGKPFPIENWYSLIHPDDVTAVKESLEKAIDTPGQSKWTCEYRFEKQSGRYAYVYENGYIIRDDNHQAVRMIGALRDISDKKYQEEKLRNSLREKETLLSEIHHRVKNNLAVVSGMMQLQAMEEPNAVVREKLHDSTLRIQTMATIHELLYQSENFSRLSFTDIIKKLMNTIEQVLPDEVTVEKEVHLIPLELNINQAIPCSLIINEVLTNCYKHAFKGREHGRITVRLQENGNEVGISIHDDGVGIPENANSSESLGLQIIQTLVQQLKAQHKLYNSGNGTVFDLTFTKKDISGIGNTLSNDDDENSDAENGSSGLSDNPPSQLPLF
ncbi:PAS domain S-box protein [Natronogracilivirga saccharolytica]|uniref:histidine kinase n=1 Tax=Natronogracilivirga saccharolytica TaxID=2812953 RepID=A0A8J7S7R5_9BACT|nr:PAS domain S-box protein [Natronogracilivirga saccharolytica]MBP3191768.1 PAS domain S-box protein [Natronogracilivirga saccharolytica]